MANEFIARKGLIIYGSTGSTLSNTTLTIENDGVVKNSLVNDLQVFNSVSGITSSLSNSLSTISTDVNSKENTINKQDSLVTDGTGIKFPTVDAINNANFISNNNVSNIIKEEFTYISGTQSFTLAATHSQVYMVSVQGQGSLSTSQYTLTAPNIVTILDTLDTNDYVTILYSTAPVAVQPYYTQGQSDSLYVPKATTLTINGVSQDLSTNRTFTVPTSNQQIRAFYPSWSSATLNTWRSWTRNTSAMLSGDTNVTGGTGSTPTGGSDANFILITNATSLTKMTLSIRETAGTTGNMEIRIASFTFNNATGRGSETNNQVLINQTFALVSGSSNAFKDNFTITPHTLDSVTGIQIYYRITSGSVFNPLQGVNLILDFN